MHTFSSFTSPLLIFILFFLRKKKTRGHSQEGLDIQASVADLLHHVIPAARVGPRPARSRPSVPGGSSRTPPDPSRAPTVAPSAWARVQLAQALRGDRGVVGTRRRLVSERLLEALLPDQGPRARHSRGRDVLQGGGGRQRGVPETEWRCGRSKERDGYDRDDTRVRERATQRDSHHAEVCLSIYQYIYLFICLSVYPPIHQSIYLYVCLSV